ncbi:hypothetical protein SAMN05421870_105233 [Streptomyces qinglanensis]|uniref:Uncharacterized protein n=1 Tax=Streptomyces qinglanensis TaxID=943816 RepID=A0A1H9T0H7_9ACTN|nr:hypothetical protein SAMN05421870_105233 [Streptomyces qinglanensis]
MTLLRTTALPTACDTGGRSGRPTAGQRPTGTRLLPVPGRATGAVRASLACTGPVAAAPRHGAAR